MITAKLFVFLSIAPGPGMLYVLARSLAGGWREGALSALGTFVGGMVHVFAAAAGVSVNPGEICRGIRSGEICWRGLPVFPGNSHDS
jgi:hypothetical protein